MVVTIFWKMSQVKSDHPIPPLDKGRKRRVSWVRNKEKSNKDKKSKEEK